MKSINISVIIPVYNEEKVIADCLNSLMAQSYRGFEIIVVDDGSSDKTLEIISGFVVKRGPQIILLRQKHKGPGAARNLGSKSAKGEVLVFVDADMTFDGEFLKDLTQPIFDGKLKGTFSKNEYVSNWDSVWARCWNINENWREKKRHGENYPDKQKVFRAILKSEFEKAGGFTPGGYTDDYSLSEKLGYEADAVKGALFYHRNPDNLREVYVQAKWAAKRKYKMGRVGFVIALIRTTFPFPLFYGVVKAFKFKEPAFVIFKLFYDTGAHLGIIEYLSKGRGMK